MFKLEINASIASRTANEIRNQKEQLRRQLFIKAVQDSLDKIVGYISKAADNGNFVTFVPYAHEEPEFTGDIEQPVVMTEDVMDEVKTVLIEGGYEVKINNKVGSNELKISWPDPREEEEEDGCR